MRALVLCNLLAATGFAQFNNCQQDGNYAGFTLASSICSSSNGQGIQLPFPIQLCSDFAKARCELSGVWHVINSCQYLLGSNPNAIRQKFEYLCGYSNSGGGGGGSNNNCVSTQDALLNKLRNAQPGTTITLCSGTMNIGNEMVAVTNQLTIRCVNQGSCTLNKLTTNSRILSLVGNGNVLEGIRFQNSRNDAGNGGAVNFLGNQNTVRDCSFASNSAQSGGALYSQGTLILSRTSFVGNRASLKGGAVYLEQQLLGQDGNSGNSNSAAQCSDIYYASNGGCGFF